ncbi:M14 family zinc carboxypeptidase [Amycolatopsis suaedae]|uniref:Peptidase M14 domain-containing protein n=1 Tax=Amycolatopsis suaedae TaxID=2510978 RepID=A0A4Q7J342_9PSEU|nr:M14 family zinc carboxypeptidase [Amycolatopsis suaedae]RZQ61198.1 hypothetical protein EWH70_25315 [Amycolatopsis suaedae]
MDVQALLDRVPEHDRFPSVDRMHAELDELAATYPDLVTLRRIGTSRLGEPLRVITVGSGSRDAVIIGGPHPNEPVGALTVSVLAQLLCEDATLRDRSGFRWHLLPCADPDGARLNETWYRRPGDRYTYSRHFYRPAMAEQVEWTFPLFTEDYVFDRCLPETQALMRLIDATRPAFVYSLHNGEFNGCFYYLSRDVSGLAGRLADLATAEGIPLHHGEPELPGARLMAPAVYETTAGSVLAAGVGAGAGSADYAATYGALHLVTEVPYWTDPRIADQAPAGITRGAVAAAEAEEHRELAGIVTASLAAVESGLVVPSPFGRAVADTLTVLDSVEELAVAAPGHDRIATVAELFSSRQRVHLFRLRLAGMLLRQLDAELAAGNATPAIRTEHARLSRLFDDWHARAHEFAPGETIPLRTLARVQLGAALLAVDALNQA